MVTVSVVHCDESKRSWLERRDWGIGPDGPTFAYGAVSTPRYWHLAAFRDRDALFGVGVVRRGNRITDLEFKLHVAAFRAAAPVPAVAAVANVLQGYSDAVHSNGRLTEARGARLLEAIRELVPGLRPTIQEFMQWVDGRPIPGAAGEQLGMEKDAIGTLLEVAGLNRSILTSWVDSGGETAFIHGLPQQLPPRAGAAPDGVSALYVTDAAEEYQPALPIRHRPDQGGCRSSPDRGAGGPGRSPLDRAAARELTTPDETPARGYACGGRSLTGRPDRSPILDRHRTRLAGH